jgi:uncharacterized protein (DUF885 family)
VTGYRYQQTAREENGKRSRQIRGMVSRRQFHQPDSEKNGQVQVVLGREAGDGSFEEDKVDVFQPVGLVANPHEYSTVESVTLFVGADGDHPVSAATLDHRKYEIIDEVGLDADEVIVYTTTSIVKIFRDSHVEIRSIDGTAVPLATKADVDALQSRLNALEQNFLGHGHPTAALGPPSPPAAVAPGAFPPTTPATITGTQKLKAE